MAQTALGRIFFTGNKFGLPYRVITGISNYVQKAPISSRTSRFGQPQVIKPAPYPYQTKRLNYLRCLLDNPHLRMDENSKVIVVEGNIGAGKTSLAKYLAEELEMYHFPEANMDMEYVNAYGEDLRNYDSLLPEGVKCCDVKTFYTNPSHPGVAKFQLNMYRHRWIQYMDALAHLLNTGQGVILERCCYSDFIFAEAMLKHGYLKERVINYIEDIRKDTLIEFLRPHLVIYLDTPVPTILERIKKRNVDYEVNSPVLTADYLSTIENIYKEKYLRKISEHAELLIYDWSDGDPEVVVEDIERIDFERFDKYDKKMEDWMAVTEDRYEMADLRWNLTYWRNSMITRLNGVRRNVPELFPDTGLEIEYERVKESVRGGRYAKGYNADAGDKGILFKFREEEVR